MKRLIILESPEKAKKIKEFAQELQISEISTGASIGHIRKLADTGKNQIGVKDWDSLEVDWMVDPSKINVVQNLFNKAKSADLIILASDPDREGEAIAWHLYEVLHKSFKIDKPFKRMRLSAITPQEFKKQLNNLTDIDYDLVNAANSRAISDKLIGFDLSRLVQETLGAKSAGRVQTPVLNMLCVRDKEIADFKKNYAYCPIGKKDGFIFNYVIKNEKNNFVIKKFNDKTISQTIIDCLDGETLVKDIESTNFSENNFVPYDTLSAYQAAKSKYGFSTAKTAKLLQSLYDKGLITYIRTDSKRLDPAFESELYAYISDKYGDVLVGKVVKPKEDEDSQDGHPAITPTDINLEPSLVKNYPFPLLESEKIYEMIYYNTLNAGLKSATGKVFTVLLKNEDEYFKTSFKEYEDYGLYQLRLSTSIPESKSFNHKIGDLIKLNFENKEIRSKPKSLYDESSLIGEMKKRKIGRPSTYAQAASSNINRNYATLNQKGKISVTSIGKEVDSYLQKNFSDFVSVDYTAKMEKALDDIAKGKIDWKEYLKEVYKNLDSKVEQKAKEIEESLESCKKCGSGKMVMRTSKKGTRFKGCSNWPDCDNVIWLKSSNFISKKYKCPICQQESMFKAKAKNNVPFEKCTKCNYIKFYNKKHLN